MTFIASLSPAHSDMVAAHVDHFDAILPNWFEREAYGVRFMGERDFPIADVEESDMSLTDWEFVAEMMWTDHRER